MKLVCDSCSSRYQVADDKVAGRVVKIRCKRCSEVIVIRGDLLESPQASAAVLTPPREPAVVATGQRNDSSVLFSLANLQQLAGAGAAASASSPRFVADDRLDAHPSRNTHDESGLIDIRALASAQKGGAREPEAGVDTLLGIGAGPSPISALGGPVLAPVAEARRDRSLVVALAALGGVVVLAAAAIIFVVVTAEPNVASASGATPGVGPITPGAGTTTDAEQAPESSPLAPPVRESSPAAAAAGEQTSPAGDETDHASDDAQEPSRPGTARRERSSRRAPRASTPRASAPPAPNTSPSAESPSLEELLDQALPTNELPATPPRAGVRRALRSVSADVSRCGRGQHGVANTTLTIAGDTGRVSHARVTGPLAGTTAATCVARAVRSARFPRFRRASFEVSFPFRL